MVEPTPLGAEIFFALAQAAMADKALRMKELLADVPHAQSAVRKNLKKLEDDGWVIIESVNNDKRAKMIIPTRKFVAHANEFINVAICDLRDCF